MEVKTSDSGASQEYNRPTVYKDVDHAPVTSVLADGDVPYADHEMDADERVINALGYKQEFKREFSLWTTFCVSFAVLGLLPSFASTLYFGGCPPLLLPNIQQMLTSTKGMGYAGTAGMVWGWIVAMIFIQCIAMAMAELCSAMPTRYSSPSSMSIGIRDDFLTWCTNSAAVSTMQQQSSHLLDMVPWLLGSPDGPTGSDRSQRRHP